MNGAAMPKTSAVLLKAAGNVRYLIAHLANEGDSVDEAECADALTAASRVEELSPQEEAAFWKNYSCLVKSVQPARVEALIFADFIATGPDDLASNPDIKKIEHQENRLNQIRRVSILAFCVTLVFFAYLSIAESAMQRNASISTEYASLSAGAPIGTAIEKDYQFVKDASDPDNPKEKDKTNNQSNNKAKENSSLDQVDAGGPAENKSQAYIEPDKKTKLQDIITTRIKELGYLAGYNDNILRFLQFRWFGKGDAVQGSPVDNGVLVTQLAVNALISKYLLPVFAALLGVTVYILRTASADMQALSFRIYDSGIYSNRLALGVVGGIAISWFSVTDTHGIVGSITPAALAFLVGYSVEVLYNVLDSLVKALGANSK
jgi:hypothetical protein